MILVMYTALIFTVICMHHSVFVCSVFILSFLKPMVWALYLGSVLVGLGAASKSDSDPILYSWISQKAMLHDLGSPLCSIYFSVHTILDPPLCDIDFSTHNLLISVSRVILLVLSLTTIFNSPPYWDWSTMKCIKALYIYWYPLSLCWNKCIKIIFLNKKFIHVSALLYSCHLVPT